MRALLPRVRRLGPRPVALRLAVAAAAEREAAGLDASRHFGADQVIAAELSHAHTRNKQSNN